MHLLFRDVPDFVMVTKVVHVPNDGRAVGRNIAKIRKSDALVILAGDDASDDEVAQINQYAKNLEHKEKIYNENCFLSLGDYVRCALQHYETIENIDEKLLAQVMLGDIAASIRRIIQ
jgi:hypothetical protein